MCYDKHKQDFLEVLKFYYSLAISHGYLETLCLRTQQSRSREVREPFCTSGKDSVKYTFTEQCEEFEGLHLEDGTTKIFLNMSSKNGTPELVSLLQYMKKTTLENPDVVIQNEKMQKLDAVVKEVKESEEWEAVSMSIYSVALEHGKRLGREDGEKLGWETLKVETFCKKLRKGKSLELIADEMEIEKDEIERMYQTAKKLAPDYDCKAVLSAWLREEANS